MDHNIINRVTCIKFLDVIVNVTLTCSDHIHTIPNKVSKNIGIIRRMSCNLSSETLMYFITRIHPFYEYCNNMWAAEDTKNLRKLVTT